MPLTQQVEAQIKKHAMLTAGETVVVAVSGGPDSVALLHILKQLQTRLDIRLVVAHLNHCLRGKDAQADALFVDHLARLWQLPCYVVARDVQSYSKKHHLSTQVAAREVRYNFLEEVAAKTGAAKVALGHHADDQAETILLHLIRGTGTGGLVGMLPMRDDFYIRPLLTIRRRAIEDYCRHHSLTTRQDASNNSVKYLRNRVRLELAPLLEQNYNPNWVEAINRLGLILQAEDQYLEQQVRQLYKKIKIKAGPDTICLDKRQLQDCSLALSRRLIRLAFWQLSGHQGDLAFQHIDQILAIIQDEGGQRHVTLPRGIVCISDYDTLQLTLKQPSDQAPFYQYRLLVPGSTAIPETRVILGAQIIPLEAFNGAQPWLKAAPSEAWFDYDCLSWPLVVRPRLPGDKFTPFGLNGQVKLKKFFIDCKVPRVQRDRLPIVVSGNNIIWVAGLRPSAHCRVTEATKNCLRLYLINDD